MTSPNSKPVTAPKSVEQLQSDFIEAVQILKGIHDELTSAQWLRDYERAELDCAKKGAA
ncbi:hypothetical protein [Delftia tsuruhatensis]|uniref:hypothetical protein n=1 Tax=Delftia tsuruhatensis TaxID=180282 RepID=UPI000AEB204F|nr:hypothetical protein [Delftia tsuruhatensis]